MPNRRGFLQSLSSVPFVGGLFSGGSALAAGPKRDFFKELGVRPFINAAGTYTMLTASLMPPEVVQAWEYCARTYVNLDQLHDAVGAKIASLIGCEAAMVTAGAASALTLGTAACMTGTNRANHTPPAGHHRDEDRGDHPENPPLRLRSRGAQLRHPVRGRGDARGTGARHQRAHGHDAVLQRERSGGPDQSRGIRRTGQEARHPDHERRRRRRAPSRESLQVHQDGLRPGDVLGRQGIVRAAERRPAAGAEGPDRGGPAECFPEQRRHRARHEGQQGGDAGHDGGGGELPEARPRRPNGASGRSASS